MRPEIMGRLVGPLNKSITISSIEQRDKCAPLSTPFGENVR